MSTARALAFVAFTASAAACGDTPETHCWFDLAYASTAEQVFVVRDCKRGDRLLYRVASNESAFEEIGEDLWLSRVEVDPIGEHLYVTNAQNRQVQLLDANSGDQIEVSGNWASNIGDLSLAPDGQALWMAVWGGRVSGVALLDTRELDYHALITVPGDPVAIDLDAAAGRIVVAPTDVADAEVIDAGSMVRWSSFETNGALDVTFLGSTGQVALLEDRASRIVLCDADSGEPVTTLETGADARRLAASSDGQTLVVTERAGDRIRVFDVPTRTERSVIEVVGGPEAIIVVGDTAYVGLVRGAAVVRIDLTSGEEMERYE